MKFSRPGDLRRSQTLLSTRMCNPVLKFVLMIHTLKEKIQQTTQFERTIPNRVCPVAVSPISSRCQPKQ